VQVLCQVYKVVYYSLRARRLTLSWLVSAGGMPSAHSAFVSSLAVSIGIWAGVATDLFAVTCVFSIIIIYDSLRLRGAVQHHARILSQLARSHPEVDAGTINLSLGHSVPEIMAGIVAGAGGALLAWAIFR
jgi:acid phosphatase family membrane protein YuiD